MCRKPSSISSCLPAGKSLRPAFSKRRMSFWPVPADPDERGDSIRFRTNESVVNEMLRLKVRARRDGGHIAVFFVDDNFAINIKRTKSLLKAIIAADAILPWVGQISINLLRDQELIRRLRAHQGLSSHCSFGPCEIPRAETAARRSVTKNLPKEDGSQGAVYRRGPAQPQSQYGLNEIATELD